MNENDDDEGNVPDVEELEEFDDVADVFESTYNFRFEEPYAPISPLCHLWPIKQTFFLFTNRGAATIQSHPRNLQSTARREESTRKDARERKKARKAEEVARKNEEVKRLKALKMREIRKKLGVIGKEAGGLLEEQGERPSFGERCMDGGADDGCCRLTGT